jgi:DNA (cytosine-5)-methyltransferase 1
MARRQNNIPRGKARIKKIPGQTTMFDIPGFSPIPETVENGEDRNDLRLRELQLRNSVEIFTESAQAPSFPPIILPDRWEILEHEAKQRNIPLKPLITPVQEAIGEIERELRRIQETGIGRLYLISGITGSGKTTFLNSLNLFVDGVSVHSIKMYTIDSRESIEETLQQLNRSETKNSIVVLEGRETPGSFKSEEIDILLTTLNQDFRNGVGSKTLFVIPTTSPQVAQSVSERAYNIGGMTSRNRQFYVFKGPDRSRFVSITNDTLRALNESRTLAEYGISDEMAKDIAESVESIRAFIQNCYEVIVDRKQVVLNHSSATKRKRVHLWMVFCSLENNSRNNYDIIRSLTFGEFQHVQVKRALIGDSQEVRAWEKRQDAFALAAQYLDLRLT